jgi:glutathione synthase/RimK-type ligase-like ATP-grasp enzyme
MTDAFFYRMLGILCDSATLACQIQGSPDQRGALTTAAPAAVPCILQQRVPRKSELRVTVVGEQVLAQSSAVEGYDDIHRCLRTDFCMRVYDLPCTVRDRCTKLIRSLGLRYGAIDFIVDKNGRLVFLEVNPTGDWNYVESQVNLPITKAMVNLMDDIMK